MTTQMLIKKTDPFESSTDLWVLGWYKVYKLHDFQGNFTSVHFISYDFIWFTTLQIRFEQNF